MKIKLSENAIGTIVNLLDDFLDDYLNRRLDPDIEDVKLIIEVSKTLGELQGAVKDNEPKKYRACKTIQEFCKLVTGNTTIQSDGQCSLYLVGCKLHIKNKSSNGESYLAISGIYIYDYEIAIKLDSVSYCFNDLFETYEIEINGEWKPFGVIDED